MYYIGGSTYRTFHPLQPLFGIWYRHSMAEKIGRWSADAYFRYSRTIEVLHLHTSDLSFKTYDIGHFSSLTSRFTIWVPLAWRMLPACSDSAIIWVFGGRLGSPTTAIVVIYLRHHSLFIISHSPHSHMASTRELESQRFA